MDASAVVLATSKAAYCKLELGGSRCASSELLHMYLMPCLIRRPRPGHCKLFLAGALRARMELTYRHLVQCLKYPSLDAVGCPLLMHWPRASLA